MRTIIIRIWFLHHFIPTPFQKDAALFHTIWKTRCTVWKSSCKKNPYTKIWFQKPVAL